MSTIHKYIDRDKLKNWTVLYQGEQSTGDDLLASSWIQDGPRVWSINFANMALLVFFYI